MARRKITQNPSIVSTRLEWLKGRIVRVWLTMYEAREANELGFTATYVDVYPIGSVYFFLFNQEGKQRLIATTAVRELSPVNS